jgi:probable rRNA maturation factor
LRGVTTTKAAAPTDAGCDWNLFMPVEVADRDGLLGNAGSAGEPHLRSVAEFLLRRFDRSDWVLSVCFVDDDEMRGLNAGWRGKDRTTDVLSFPQIDDEDGAVEPAAGEKQLGDVVISVPRASAQAADGGWTVDEELSRLLLHGMLHLLGYDHETDEEEARKMRRIENEAAAALIEAGMPCASEST